MTVLVVVLLAEVAGNGFAAEYKSVVEGTVLVGTILFWSYMLEWAAHRFPTIERLIHPQTLLESTAKRYRNDECTGPNEKGGLERRKLCDFHRFVS